VTDRAFAPLDWALVAGVACTWVGRVFFGAVTLTAVPRARAPVPRSEWPQIALLGVLWMAVPFMLFSIAQQWIDSSLAGMINAAAPLFTAVVAGIVVRHLPGRIQAVGLVLGFVGVLAISWPSLGEGESTGVGVGLVLLATVLYGCAFNLAAPLQRRNGALPVIWRAQLVSLALLLPIAAASVASSDFELSSLLAVVALGSLGTAVAYVLFTTLVGRVGSTRGAVTIYLLPVVAIGLGAIVRDEPIHAAALLGTALVLAGAYLVSREERRAPVPAA
jgi:drug/metabolite transporter (DMT)-like permease